MRNLIFPNYLNIKFLALLGAIGLHLAAFAMMYSKPMAISEQFIQVNLARPSKQNFEQQKSIKLENNFIVAKKTSDLAQNNVNKFGTLGKKELIDNKAQNSPSASGEVSKDAIADNGAYTKPVFDAPSLKNGAPEYPQYARRNGIQGKVILEVEVNSDGSAGKVFVVSSSGYSTLDQAAFEAVKNWRFIPARLNGKTVASPVSVLIPIIFSFS